MNLPARHAIEAELYRKSYYDFFKAAFPHIPPPPGPFTDNFHIKLLCDRLQVEAERITAGKPKDRDLILNTPFRASKSIIATIAFNAWVWTWNPRMTFICVSFSADLALQHAVFCRKLIESEWYRSHFPDVKLADDQNAKGYFATTEGGSRRSLGTGGQITGSGADIVICDDPQDPQRADSEVERQNTKDFFSHTLYSRPHAGTGLHIIVQQRLHEQDLTGYLLEGDPQREFYEHICLPGELNDTLYPPELASYYVDGQFWPTRFTEKVRAGYLHQLGARVYANQFLQKPAPAEGLVFQRKWFPLVTQRPAGTVNFFLDTASTDDSKNDATAVITCIKTGEEWTIVHATTVRFTMPDLITWLPSYIASQGGTAASLIHIENKSSGIALLQLLRRSTRLQIRNLEPGKLSKIERAQAATVDCSSGRVKLLDGTWVSGFLDEVCVYPAGKHDDLVDALSYMVNTKPSAGLSYSF